MELRHLRYFTVIAELSNVTRAAERLHVTQPALSRQIRDLEDEVGRILFERVNNGVRLTDAGRKFFRGARRLLAASDALLAGMRDRDSNGGTPLRIANFGTLSAQYFSPYLRKLARRFPELRVEVDEELPQTALRRVRAGKLDAFFSGLADDAPLRGLESRVVWNSPQEILIPANHRLAKRRKVTMAELRDERWAIWDRKLFPGFTRHFTQACREAGFRPQIGATFDSLVAIFFHVAEGGLIGYAPTIARSLSHPGVEFIPTDPGHAFVIPVSLVWRSDLPHANAVRWLADTMERPATANPDRLKR